MKKAIIIILIVIFGLAIAGILINYNKKENCFSQNNCNTQALSPKVKLENITPGQTISEQIQKNDTYKFSFEMASGWTPAVENAPNKLRVGKIGKEATIMTVGVRTGYVAENAQVMEKDIDPLVQEVSQEKSILLDKGMSKIGGINAIRMAQYQINPYSNEAEYLILYRFIKDKQLYTVIFSTLESDTANQDFSDFEGMAKSFKFF